jgi:predicted PurR-regulated permease PerM
VPEPTHTRESGLTLPSSLDQYAFDSPSLVAPEETDGKRHPWREVPWRTIVVAVAIVFATYVMVAALLATLRIVAWVMIAGFFAVVLSPAVRRVQQRVGGRRALATGIVVLTTLLGIAGLVALFILPVREQLAEIVTDLPGTIQQAADGRGPVGGLVRKLGLVNYVQDHERQLQDAAERLEDSSVAIAQGVLEGLLAFVTITLLTFFFLSQAKAIGGAFSNVVPARRRDSVTRITKQAASAISGYMVGNLLVSLYAGVAALIALWILGVPSPIVLALWVAFADLIPLIGATLGALVAVLAAFLHSLTAGIVALVFFVVYQQIENGVIYPVVMARKVKVNPLVVLLSVLLGVELFGFLGALLAVPVSGALQVIVKSVNIERQREKLLLPDSTLR